MNNVMIKTDLDHDKLIELGYTFSVMEGGFVSKDAATIVSIDRRPYERQVMQYRANAEVKHLENVEKLKQIDALE